MELPPWHTLFIDGMNTKKEPLKDKSFVLLSEGGNRSCENKRPLNKVPFRHYVTLTPTMECFISQATYSEAEWHSKAGGKNEYVGEWRAGWKKGGNNINNFNRTTGADVAASAAGECGTIYPTTM